MEETNITISKLEYDFLKQSKLKYEMLMNYILNGESTKLSKYNGNLKIDGDDTIKAVKIIDPIWYQQALNIKIRK